MRTLCVTFLFCGLVMGQAMDPDITTLDADGTAHITRLVAVPKTLSPEAQKLLATGQTWAPGPRSPESKRLIEDAQRIYPVKIEEKAIGGVRGKLVTPASGVPAAHRDRMLICLHGGGFTTDSGSFLESIPIASLTQTAVFAVDYRLAPVNKFPAAVDDVIAVYKELLKTYRPERIVIYGTSAGAALTAQTAVRIKREYLPFPAALGLFSNNSDATRPTDSAAFFAVPGLSGVAPPEPGNQRAAYLGDHNPSDPLASPTLADLHGLPPTLCMTGTRDSALSGTALMHRALRRAGVEAQLIVYDGLPHAFWYEVNIPEAQEALKFQAGFFNEKLDAAAKAKKK
jgi:acetyl esterase/lipase